ncbi:uncharacterized protein CTHT_0035300 [Thermochaetoides thermophila DSM 1495]|uniref:Chitobiosyldiphosphodolichol beta-mannosyltransferase n=1 Tax=Chaetomium thermophilum (strain DSM 1495 / CBS 144.50 / IMI 039719) TaxID=759272 RepID=G0S6R2_CHATD|nr:hypothetical protein CTHT_0035300 [Thermochaetoides thermophila DSM 1495]EGS21664.1 hypothetical protein CTHT_0035300 [Thermochaetoides thermophila DSM 1495]
MPFILFAPFKVIYQIAHLARLLAYTLPPAQWILVQNPPSIPALAISSLLRNPPYSISQPMLVVHDRPAAIFQPLLSNTPLSTKEEILSRVVPDSEKPLIPSIITGKTRLIVSSTSWTPDEDFSLLLDALLRYAAATTTSRQIDPPTPPPLLAIITGKGPQKAHYVSRIADLTREGRLPNVRVATAFLPFEDYAALLAVADLGVCLHRSSSGVDLPMKVVDMFGAGLPVAAYCGYESFSELVKDGENGEGFETADELAEILKRLLSENGSAQLEKLRKGAVIEGSRRWDEEWDSKVGMVLGLVS